MNRLSPIKTFSPTEGEQGFDLRQTISFAWRQWKFITVIVGTTLLVAAVYLVKQTPRYTASALVLLEPRKEKAAGAEAILSDVNLDYAMIESQLAIIRSTAFLQRVVEKARLVSDPEFGSGPVQGTEGSQSSQDSQASSLESGSNSSNVTNSIEALKGATAVARAGQGYVLSISVTSVDPARAARLANAVADAFVLDKLDARFEAAKRASAWLSDRLVELRKELRESEEAVAQFRAEHGFVQNSANVTLNQQQLSELNAKVVTARAEVAEKKARLELLRTIE